MGEGERDAMPEGAQQSRFIADSKHIEGERMGTFEDASTYHSYKLGGLAYQFQCVVTRLGQCVRVSEAARAATHDTMVYRGNRVSFSPDCSQGGSTAPSFPRIRGAGASSPNCSSQTGQTRC